MMTLLIVGLLVLLPVCSAFAKNPVKDLPLEVTSDRLEADETAHRVTFYGQVVARQGEVVIYAEILSIFYAGNTREVARIVAENDVRIVQGSRVVTGGRAEYDNQTGIIELTGQPKVHQGKDAVSGDKITVYLNEEKSVISSKDGSRVNALFHPNEAKP